MKQKQIVEDLREIITHKLDINVSKHSLDEKTTLMDGGLSMDSIVIVNFIVQIEKRFGLKLPLESLNLEYFNTLGSLATYLSDLEAE